ncbi:MAG TPA: hypothetical protein VJM32_05400 [Candidatus Saccharimonadales bacterium]|nr:hypothetical protein [Candidatus Saccharimonadales bacterium]
MHVLTAIGNAVKSLLPLMPQGTIIEPASNLRLVVGPDTKVVLHTPFSATELVVVKMWGKFGQSHTRLSYFNSRTADLVVGFGGHSAIATALSTTDSPLRIRLSDEAPSLTRVVLDQELIEPGRLVVIDHADPLYLVEVHVRPGLRVVVEVIEPTGGKK